FSSTERFAFLASACRTVMKHINFKADIVHCHDWHVGMVPTLIKEQNKDDVFYKDMKFILTIHNPAFKGIFNPYILGDMYGLEEEVYSSGRIRFNDQVSTLKAAIMYCDKITTVSPTHAKELLSYESGHDLQDVLKYRRDDFVGILNGIDYKEFDSSIDKRIATPFTIDNLEEGKKKNKDALLKELNLKTGDAPLFGMVSRLTWQKGVDLVIEGCRHILEKGGYVAILGSGEYNYEQELEKLRAQYPTQMGIYIGYSDDLAHRIYAASDFFLMPSLFEPCGIGQMIALRYATLPMVRLTGGLMDTVIPFEGKNENKATGFGFYEYDKWQMIHMCDEALKVYDDKELLSKLRNNAFSCVNNWEKSAKAYVALYKSAQKK
ncbi:MAG: glycogen synthase, partial [Bacilli bacterium]|nr:glycogen synthase [Bacilli bacterium]